MIHIPQGFHSINAHLTVANANEAIRFYQQVFGAEELYRLEGPGGMVMHADLRIGDSTLWIGDENPGWGTKSAKTLGGSAVTVNLYVADVDKVVAKALSAGAQIKMPVTEMFWGDRYAQIVDPFGQTWAVATRTATRTPDEIKKAFAAMMSAGK